MYSLYFIIVLLTFPIAARCVIIHTLSGPIKGVLLESLNVKYYAYRGIPYAEPPNGTLRFMPPVEIKPWTEILDATKFGPVCPQAEGVYTRDEMSEDCLNLNVYVPRTHTNRRLPVLVLTPSGEFKSNSGRDNLYGPGFLMKHDVIVVTYNYRLGALGFLSVLTKEAPGNAGLKDALLALKWIKVNIHLFAGDPDNITLSGDSAGAVVVHYLLLTEKSIGLFNRVSLISGSALGYRFLNRHPVETVKDFGARMGYDTENIDRLIETLKTADLFKIVAAQNNYNDPRSGYRPYSPFVPVIEKNTDHALITQHPIKTIKYGLPHNVSIIAGFNSQEGIKMLPVILNNFTLAEILNNNFELCIPSNIEYPYGSTESRALARSIKQFYFNNKDISNSTLQNFVNLVSDTQFSFSTDLWIKIYKELSHSNDLYYYVFDFDGDLNWYKLNYDVKFKGASHMDQAGYMYETQITKPLLDTASEESNQTLRVLTSLWSNFAKYGVPTNGDGIKVNWDECGEKRNYLCLNNSPYMVDGPPSQERMNFWYQVYSEYDQYVYNGGTLEPKVIP